MNYVIFLKLFILIIWACACPDNYREAIRQALGFQLQMKFTELQ